MWKVQILNSVEDEKLFSTLIMMKSKFDNMFITQLPFVVCMFT
jgi:hypothetical protein